MWSHVRASLFLFALAAVTPAHAQRQLVGRWAGGSNLFPARPGFVQARFDVERDDVAGFVSVPGWDAAKRRAVVRAFGGDSVRFEFPSAAGTPFVVTGRVRGDVFLGTIARGAERGDVHLIRVAEPVPHALDELVGTYDAGGHPHLVTWSAFGGLRLVNLDDAYGDALLPLPDGSLAMGRSVATDTVPDERLTFERGPSGAIDRFTLSAPGRPPVVARRVRGYRQERVTFRNGDVRLAGTLLSPDTPLRHSAVVFVHGSQDRGRDDAYDFSAASFYLNRGVAVLLYDKRGVGGSGGDWHVASFDDLAGDALAGVRLLRGRKDVDARQVGLQGVSQGGWIAPLAAARSRDVAFVVAISAAGVPPAEQVRFDQMRQIRADTLVPAAQHDSADAFIRTLYRSLHDRDAARELEALLPTARTRPWFRYTIAGIPRSSWIWESSRLTAHVDPTPVWRRVRCPVLLLFGEVDPNYPAATSAREMQRALAAGGNRDVTSWIAPGANHSMRVRLADGRWISAPGLEGVQHDWLLRHVNVDF